MLFARTLPALFTRISSFPHSLIGASIKAFASFQFETSQATAIAVPPAAEISAATASAGPLLAPDPSTWLPLSAMTALAPSVAISSAVRRPTPRPLPVTIVKLPSNFPGIFFLESAAQTGSATFLSRRVYIQRWNTVKPECETVYSALIKWCSVVIKKQEWYIALMTKDAL